MNFRTNDPSDYEPSDQCPGIIQGLVFIHAYMYMYKQTIAYILFYLSHFKSYLFVSLFDAV
jgi:hypothetical protein